MDLKKMMGPLPLWGWLAIILGGLGIAWWSMQSDSGDAIDGPTEVTDTSGYPGVGNVGTPGYVERGGPVGGDDEKELLTNEEWGKAAIEELIAQGYNASDADTAIRKYLAAKELTAQENALVTRALYELGAPPVPLPPPVMVGGDGDNGEGEEKESWPAPTNVRASVEGKGNVRITFNEPSPPAPGGYRVYSNRHSTNMGHSMDGKIVVGELRPGKSYRFHVRSVNRAGKYGPKSGYSNTVTVRG